MKISFTILTLFLIHFYIAQTPGYLGKRLSIEGSVNVLPRATEYILGNEFRPFLEYQPAFENNGYYSRQANYLATSKINKNYKPVTLNLKASLSINYVLSQKTEASLRYTYLRNSIVIKNHNNRTGKGSNYHKNNKSLFFTTIDEDIEYKVSEFELNFKFYKKGFIAPVGKYFLLGLGVSKISSVKENIEINYLVTDYNYDNSGIAGPEYDASYWNYHHSDYVDNLNKAPKLTNKKLKGNEITLIKLNLGLGEKHVFKNNVYLMYEAEINIYNFRKNRLKTETPSSYSSYQSSNQDNISESFSKSIDLIFERTVRRHIALDNLFNLKIGFGIIL